MVKTYIQNHRSIENYYLDGKTINVTEYDSFLSIDKFVIIRDWALTILDLVGVKHVNIMIIPDGVIFTVVNFSRKRWFTKKLEKEITPVLKEIATLQGLDVRITTTMNRDRANIFFEQWPELNVEDDDD